MKTSLYYTVLAMTALAAIVFVATFAQAFFYSPASDLEVPIPGDEILSRALSEEDSPARLIIPSIGVDADIQHVGITKSGNMAVPSNFSDVGWYRYGTVPGDFGSAVVAGHVDNGLGLAGVFKRLDQTRVGDDVYLESERGIRLHYIVSAIESYPYDAVPVETLFNRADTSRLNLVSCEGSWIATKKTYDTRIVVYTRLVAD
jgi:LPXTG-site transpeptidase (sortase) family protein